MTKFWRALTLVLIMILTACASSPAYWTYTTIEAPTHITHPDYIPVWVDSTFTPRQVEELRAAIKEWDYVLNGQIVFYLAEQPAKGKDGNIHNYPITFSTWEAGHAIEQQCEKTDLGIVVFNLPSTSKHMPAELSGGTLAFVRGKDAHAVNVVTDRIGTRSIKDIVMHELAHILGADHVNMNSLENPYYSQSQTNCIDKVTVAQVAHEQNLRLEELNYCITPNFE